MNSVYILDLLIILFSDKIISFYFCYCQLIRLIWIDIKHSIQSLKSLYSGAIGSGLCMFSKYQILETFYHNFPLNGYAHKIHHGDWFGGKGLGMCRLKVQDFRINVYITHVSTKTFYMSYKENLHKYNNIYVSKWENE